jgi:hypothetical protein
MSLKLPVVDEPIQESAVGVRWMALPAFRAMSEAFDGP